MSDGLSVGVSFASTIPVARLIESYRLAEQCGFNELWIHEDYFYHGGFAAAAMALTATTRVTVGIGIVSALVRHPAVTAMEIATLAGAHPGRLRVGIGHGAPEWMRQLGLQQKSPLGTLREVLTSVRRLLRGETLSQSGVFHFDAVRLAYPCPDVPLYAGVIGPKSLALSGEIADGTVVSVMAGPKYIERARKITADAAARSARARVHVLPTLSYCFIDRDGAVARRAARAAIAQMLGLAGPDLLTQVYGIDDALRDMIARGGAQVVEAEMPDEWIDWFAAAGEPDQCLERLRLLSDAGSTSVVLALTDPATVRSSLDLLAAEVLPRFASSRGRAAQKL
jgi:alkanesulfonate monooxygenase SsuD/methylene tetrahydromethanopterin reductase-like flavin-dependent oxidoreductase (luciferase family)